MFMLVDKLKAKQIDNRLRTIGLRIAVMIHAVTE